MFTTDLAGMTDTGTRRKENQDSFLISSDKRLIAVADGLSRSADCNLGAEVSRLAVETLESFWNTSQPDLTDDSAVKDWLDRSVQEANKVICNFVDKNGGTAAGATTILAAVQTNHNKVHIAHVGDSRAYAMKDGVLRALTEDHTFMNHMKHTSPEFYEKVTTQKIHACYTPDLMRVLGWENQIVVDLTEVELVDNDVLLLCSDGLYDLVSDQSIRRILSACTTADGACKELLSEAIESGGYDNVTVVVQRKRLAL
jgi:Serine/threonine protein phosphatase